VLSARGSPRELSPYILFCDGRRRAFFQILIAPHCQIVIERERSRGLEISYRRNE